MTDEFDPPTEGLRRRATTGVVIIGLSQLVRVAVQFGSVVVLSRLLLPAEFGLLAMAGPVVGFAALFQDLGLTQAVVQKKRLTQQEVSALFAVSFGMSVALALLLLALAPVAGAYYGEPRVATLTAAMSLNVMLGGVGSLHYALLNRRMRFDVLAAIDATAALAGLAAAVAGALVTHSFWALYVGNLVSALVPACGYWLASGWRPSRPRLGLGLADAFHFGANVTGFNVANFFARNLDNVLIGHAWGNRPLGLYDRAYKLLLLPLQQINNPISKVMLPVLSQLAADPDRYRGAFLRTLAQMLLVTLPGIAFMVGTADLLIPLLLGRQWADAAPIFAALGLASFPQALNNPAGWLFMSQNRTREFMYWGLFGSATCILSFAVGLPYDAYGVAVAYTVGEYLRTPLLWWYVTRRGPIRVQHMLHMALPHAVGALAALAGVAMVRAVLPAEPLVTLGASLAAAFGASLLAVSAFPQGRQTLRNTAGLLARRHAGPVPAG